MVKLFALDIDFTEEGMLPAMPLPWELGTEGGVSEDELFKRWQESFTPSNPRLAWRDRAHPARAYMKACLRTLADRLERQIRLDLQIPTCVAYSGNKGLHVYGFTGKVPAREAREGMHIILEALPLEKARGNVIWRWNPTLSAEELLSPDIFTIETFPKQDQLSDNGFGNLMRLPLGKNQKSPDPTFFVDTDKPMSVLQPADPLETLQRVENELNQ
jgi:hypothetical protein